MTDVAYEFRNSKFGPPMTATLSGDHIAIAKGADHRAISLLDIGSIRIYSTPAMSGPEPIFCDIKPNAGRKLRIKSTSFVGIGKFADQTQSFRTFVEALLQAVAAANPQAQLLRGQSMPVWITYIVILSAALIVLAGALVAALVGALPTQAYGSLLILVVFLPGIWRVVRRGRPRRFLPGALDPFDFSARARN